MRIGVGFPGHGDSDWLQSDPIVCYYGITPTIVSLLICIRVFGFWRMFDMRCQSRCSRYENASLGAYLPTHLPRDCNSVTIIRPDWTVQVFTISVFCLPVLPVCLLRRGSWRAASARLHRACLAGWLTRRLAGWLAHSHHHSVLVTYLSTLSLSTLVIFLSFPYPFRLCIAYSCDPLPLNNTTLDHPQTQLTSSPTCRPKPIRLSSW
jgi:hypothetical protein